ncbi:MAG: transporter substrate-binding domain-containing protein [Bacteriovorax sp.]|nr:transporter substrate-binding domain-containing protein [Rhizobacter sp.]
MPAMLTVPFRRSMSWHLAAWLLATALSLVVSVAAAQDKRTLVVGSEQDYPPFAVGMSDTTAGGFTVELWQAIAKEQGLNYTIRVRPFDELLRNFKAGDVEVLLNLAKSDDRRLFADFSATHVVVGGAIFARQGDARIRSEGDLAGKSVIVIKGDLAHDFAAAKGWAPQLVLVDTAEQGLRLLASGKHDAMLISKLVGMQTIRNKGIDGVAALDVKVEVSQRFAFAVRKGDTELLSRINEGLALAKTNGVYDRLYEKWFGAYEVRTRGWRELWQAVTAVALLAASAFAVMFRNRLRRDRRSAAVLRDSEERWKFALEGAGDGVWDTNLVTGASLYSKRWKEILGYAEDEIGITEDEWSGRIHPDDLPRVLRESQECLDNKVDGFISEFRMRAKDGRWIWILDRGKVVERSSDGRALRMIGTHTDISARKAVEAREAARSNVMTKIASGSSLPAIFDSIVRDVECRVDWRCSIMLADATGTRLFTSAAPSLPASFNAAIDELQAGANQGCCGTAAHAKSRAITEDIRADARWSSLQHAAVGAGLQSCWSEPILSADGALLGTFASYRDRPSVPSPAAIESIVDAAHMAAIAVERQRAIEALRESEALLCAKSRTLEITLERMEQGVMMVSADRVVEVCNRRAIELLDLPVEWMVSKPSFDQVLDYQWSIDDFADTPDDVRQFVRRGGVLDQAQFYERKRPNGRTIEFQSIPLDGGGVLRTYSDITDRKHAESKRQRLEAQLLEARKLEAIGTLAGGIAHDFNNIMAAILGNAALARDDLGEGHPVQRLLGQITKAGQRARSLVQQILAFSRQQPSEFASIPLRPLVEESVAMLRSMAGPRSQLRALLPDTKLAVMGNSTQLQQILMNLGTNALQALPEGVGQIDIGLEERRFADESLSSRPAGLEPGAYAHIWVRDNGCGMDARTREHIFEPFFTTKPVGRGTGLGLAVVHGIVKTLGGVIDVTSEVGRGSTFGLFLPLVEHDSQIMPLDLTEVEPARGRGQHIVYIDDDEVMALMVQDLLMRLGYRATCFLAAHEAIDAIASRAEEVDLVVTDFNMPNLSGLDVVRVLAGIRPGLPVVISSGYVSDDLRASAAELGVRAVMQKERTIEELGAVVHAALGTVHP